MDPENMVRYSPVIFRFHLIQHDKQKIKTRQKGVLHSDIIHGRLELIILKKILLSIKK